MEPVLFNSSSDKSMSTHKSPTVRTLNRQAGILPSPPLIMNQYVSSYPPFSYNQNQPPLLPLPDPSLLRNSNMKTQNTLVRGLSFPQINIKPNKITPSNSIAPRKTTSSLSTSFKNLKQSTTAKPAGGYSKDAVSAGGSKTIRSKKDQSKIEQASPKLTKEMDKVGECWESVIFTLSPPPSSLPLPSFSILRPKIGCRY